MIQPAFEARLPMRNFSQFIEDHSIALCCILLSGWVACFFKHIPFFQSQIHYHRLITEKKYNFAMKYIYWVVSFSQYIYLLRYCCTGGYLWNNKFSLLRRSDSLVPFVYNYKLKKGLLKFVSDPYYLKIVLFNFLNRAINFISVFLH